jgi:hypothetical protein
MRYDHSIRPILSCLLLFASHAARADVSQPAQVAAEAYVRAAGFASVDFAPVARRIPGLGVNMTPPEVAALLLEAREAKGVWRTRTIVRMERRRLENDVVDLVEIERFNLGPVIRAAMIHDTGSAPEAQGFGTGPNVAWRVVTTPNGPLGATIIAAGRRDYEGFESKDRECAGLLCLSVAVTLEQHGVWTLLGEKTLPPSPSPYPAVVTHSDGQIDLDDETLAHALRDLAALGGLASTGNGLRWQGPPDGQRGLMLIDNEVNNNEDGIVCPVLATTPPQCTRRTVVVGGGPAFTVDQFSGTLKRE